MESNLPDKQATSPEILTNRTVAIKIIGIGGAGSNAVDRLKKENLDYLQLAVVNTDNQALVASQVEEKVMIGSAVTRGLGAGGDPEVGKLAAESDSDKIARVVEGSNLIFLLAGMGGGTGSGAAPIVAEAASEAGALVIAFVTMPFSFEGGRRLKQAEEGLEALRKRCDAVIPLPNDILLQEGSDETTVVEAFAKADEWIGRGVKAIWSMLFRTGLINLDFATLRQAFHRRSGKTLFGLGLGHGPEAAAEALNNLRLCPLRHTPEFSRKADRLLVNIVGGPDLSLAKVNEMMTVITEEFGRESHVFLGAAIDAGMKQSVEICILGTTDLAGRAPVVRKTPPAKIETSRPEAKKTAPVLGEAQTPSEAQVELPVSVLPPTPLQQVEFTFNQAESRGQFDKTDRNLFEGQDLDVPTYLRKGIKIIL